MYVGLHIIRNFIKYYLKNVIMNWRFSISVFEILLFKGRSVSVLGPAQLVPWSKCVNQLFILSGHIYQKAILSIWNISWIFSVHFFFFFFLLSVEKNNKKSIMTPSYTMSKISPLIFSIIRLISIATYVITRKMVIYIYRRSPYILLINFHSYMLSWNNFLAKKREQNKGSIRDKKYMWTFSITCPSHREHSLSVK